MLIGCSATAHAQSMADRAQAAAAASRARTSDSNSLLQNVVTPGLSGQPISTIDGKTSFTAALACEKSAKWLELLVQPSATGDLGTVTISRDTNFDGSFDTALTLPMPVSGICANGIISCTPGTWDACEDFQWAVDGAGALKLTQVDMPNLTSCYCINNSCGHDLAWSNMPSVLGDLGGGVVGALTTADPRYGAAQASINGPVIDYVGAQSTSCASSPAVGQTAYASNPTAIQADAASQASSNSIFQMLKGSPAGTGKVAQTRSCTIQREVTVTSPTYDEIVTATGSFESVTICGAGCRIYRIGGTGNCDYPPPTFTGRFTVAKPDRLVSARLTDIQTADFLQARVNGTIVASAGEGPWMTDALPSDCGTGDDHSAAPNTDLSALLRQGAVTIDARIHAHGSHKSGYLDVRIEVDTGCEATEDLADLCSGYEGQSQCQLLSEDVDGVTTVTGGVHTGLTPLPQTRQFGSASCALSLTRPFFERDRQYRCVIDSGTTAAPDLSRGAYIIDHSTETLLADQTRSANGTVTTTTAVFSSPSEPAVPACEAICKTRAPAASTAAAPVGVTGSQQNDPTGWNVYYHTCSGGVGSTDTICPAGPGEEVVSACGCLDEFPEAAVMMQSVRLAGSDLTCNAGSVQ
ncbi:hypothetical protein HZF05_10910 [Sphingomonas sp. CGMCC 1.13654]|uniref:Conjugal transfer protein TraN n=2 Tax=Sphingomonas chungangi TaxID=2683589 RepID=A0A838L607_9SPHN|nr:hypothetical protein [Sphingomonas chungangi]MVW57640.1 hypothetical protein [Sphingomonas chungangi]